MSIERQSCDVPTEGFNIFNFDYSGSSVNKPYFLQAFRIHYIMQNTGVRGNSFEQGKSSRTGLTRDMGA